MARALSPTERAALFSMTLPLIDDERRSCVSVWLTQDLSSRAVAAPRASSSGALLAPIPLIPQRFNGPCGLLSALQAEVLLDVAAGDPSPFSSSVARMLSRAAGGSSPPLLVTELHCPCGGVLCEPPPPPTQADASGLDAAMCVCGAPIVTELHWAGPLWCALPCGTCGTRICIDCATVVVDCLSSSAIPQGRGSALLLLFSLALSATTSPSSSLHNAQLPLVGIDESGAVGCADAMLTLAVWGVAHGGGFGAAAAVAAGSDVSIGVGPGGSGGGSGSSGGGDRPTYVGILLEGANACYAPHNSPAPCTWIALAGGHWRVICDDTRIVSPSLEGGMLSALCIDGLPGRKTRSMSVGVKLLHATAPAGARAPTAAEVVATGEGSSTVATPPLAPLPPERFDRAGIIGKARLSLHSREYHVVWEAEHEALEGAFGVVSSCKTNVADRWYCRQCYFVNERSSLTYGVEGWRNCFNASDAIECRACGVSVASCGRSWWVAEDVLRAVAPALLAAHDAHTSNLLELSLRSRWAGSRVTEEEEVTVEAP